MSIQITDGDGDYLRVRREDGRITFEAAQIEGMESAQYATVGPVDPEDVIAAIHEEMGWNKPDLSPVVEAVAEQINDGKIKVDGPAVTGLTYEEAVARKGRGEDVARARFPHAEKIERLLMDADREGGEVYRTDGYTRLADYLAEGLAEDVPEDPEVSKVNDALKVAHTARAVAQNAENKADRARALANEALDQAGAPTQQEAHQSLADYWGHRLDVVREAMTMLPEPGKVGGIAAAPAGETPREPNRVERALKIARFAVDEDRDIPGVDK